MVGKYLKTVRARVMAAITVITGLLAGGFDIIANFGEVIWMSAGSLFSALSISAFTLGDAVAWLPADLLSQLALFIGVVYVMKLLHDVWRSFNEVDDDDG